jgi:hypothetical protein
MIATRAARRQPEYSFAPSGYIWSGGTTGYDGGMSYPYCPAIFPLPRDDLPFEPKAGEVFPSSGIGTQDAREVDGATHM